jgi:hypothetical protein
MSPQVEPVSFLRRAWRTSPALTFTTGLMLLGSVISGALIFLDPRTLVGVPGWVKPTKFFLSVTLYTGTLAWVGTLVREQRRVFRTVTNVSSAVVILELAWIAGQVVRGTRSHFNEQGILNLALGASMGLSITALWISNIVLAVMLRREPGASPVLVTGARLGVWIAVLGMASGFLMFLGDPGHTIGAPDGGPGLPFLNWSTTHGDWRPGHFLGLHGLQALPLLALLLTGATRLTQDQRLKLVRIAAVGYGGLTVCLLIQAARAQSIVHPDAVTWLTFTAVVGFAIVAGARALLSTSGEEPAYLGGRAQ